jgi:multidrug transporter EmrE-like cation transporter
VSFSESKRYGIILAMVCSIAVILSLTWAVPYLYTAIGFAIWALVGHLITLDDDDVSGG